MIDIFLIGITAVIILFIGVWTWSLIKVIEHLISKFTEIDQPTRRIK